MPIGSPRLPLVGLLVLLFGWPLGAISTDRSDDRRPTSEATASRSRTIIEDAALAAGQRLVVMIESDIGIGAGIVVGRDGQDVAIATANHVIRRGPQGAESVRVQFRSSPGEWIPAKLTEDFAPERELDLAVLTVRADAAPFDSLCSLPFGRLDATSSMVRGSAVFPVGFPHGAPWATPLEADLVASAAGGLISFQSSFVARGMSGGALVDHEGMLVGMIKDDQPPFGVAVAMPKVLDTMRAWGYAILLYDPARRAESAPLQAAAARADLEAVRRLIDDCHDPDARNSAGATALEVAVTGGATSIVQLLLDAGASLDVGDPPQLLLHAAARGGHAETMRLLLARGLAPNNADANGATALHVAARRDDVEIARLLLDVGADLTALQFDEGSPLGRWRQTPLHTSAEHGAAGVARVLLDAGAKVNDREGPDYGATPLHLAAHSGRFEVARMLVEAGADVNARLYRNVDAQTPLELAIVGARQVASDAPLRIVSLLLDHGADPNRLASQAVDTPLHLAVESARPGLVALLAQRGAQLEARASRGRTPIHAAVLAAATGSFALTEVLIDHGARLDVADDIGQTPLHLAAAQGLAEAARRLAKAGARIDSLDKDSRSPLHLAVEEGHHDTVLTLLALGADPNAAPPIEAQPLHAAVETGNTALLKRLLDAGAYIHAMDRSGDTPLHLALRHPTYPYVARDPALRNKYLKIAQALISAGANLDIGNDSGLTPREMAVRVPEIHTLVRSAKQEALRQSASALLASADPATPLIQLGHSSHIWTAAVSPAGELVVTGARDGVVIVWDRSTGREVRRLIGHLGPIRDVTFASGGSHVVSAGEDATVRVWDVASGQTTAMVIHDGPVASATLSDDRATLVTIVAGDEEKNGAGGGARVWRWDAAEDRYRAEAELSGPLRKARLSRDEKSILFVGISRGAWLIRLSDGTRLGAWDRATGATFSTDGSRVLVASEGAVSVFDIETGKELRRFAALSQSWRGAVAAPHTNDRVVLADIHGNGSTLMSVDMKSGQAIARTREYRLRDIIAVPSEPHVLILREIGPHFGLDRWNPETGEVEPVLEAPKKLEIAAVSVIADAGEVVATGTVDDSLWAFRIRNGRVVAARELGDPKETWRSGVNVVMAPYASHIGALGAGGNSPLFVWDVESDVEPREFSGDFTFVTRFGGSPLGGVLVTSSHSSVTLWDLHSGRATGTFPSEILAAVTATPNGRAIVAVKKSGERIRIWDVETGVERRYAARGPSYDMVAMSPAGDVVALAGERSVTKLWSLEREREIDALGSGPIRSLGFSSDGKWLVAGGDSDAYLWNLTDRGITHTLRGHGGEVRAAAFSTEMGLVVTGGADGTVRFWDPETGVERLRVALFEGGEWVSQTPEGAFDASENGLAYLVLRRDGAFASDEEIERRFRNAEAVAAAVGIPSSQKTIEFRKATQAFPAGD